MILKEYVAYYINSGRTVYFTMLDATKAFDRVEYCKLFKFLIGQGLPQIIRPLLNMCAGHLVRISWNGVYSNSFPVKNGVKQGAVISPVLFYCYLDKLLFNLDVNCNDCFAGKCLSVHSHMLAILRRRLVQCIVYYLLVIVLLTISRSRSMLKKYQSISYLNLLVRLVVLKLKSLFFTLKVMQLRLLTNGLILSWSD